MQCWSGIKLAMKRQESPKILKSCKRMNACSIFNCYSLLSGSFSLPCWKVRSLCRAGREYGTYSSAAVVCSLVTQHKPTSTQSWGVVKSQRKIYQRLYPHLCCYHSCLLISCPEVKLVSALHWCVMDITFMGTKYIVLLAVWPYASRKQAVTKWISSRGGIFKSMLSLTVPVPFGYITIMKRCFRSPLQKWRIEREGIYKVWMDAHLWSHIYIPTCMSMLKLKVV